MTFFYTKIRSIMIGTNFEFLWKISQKRAKISLISTYFRKYRQTEILDIFLEQFSQRLHFWHFQIFSRFFPVSRKLAGIRKITNSANLGYLGQFLSKNTENHKISTNHYFLPIRHSKTPLLAKKQFLRVFPVFLEKGAHKMWALNFLFPRYKVWC